jgi:diguanylate cyclase (GGDEF)-like protein/PAS domain S-box-containing protein
MSIKHFVFISAVTVSSLLLLLLAVVYQSRDIQQDISIKEQRRLNSILLAKELVQSSDDLTRMARGYAATGDPTYKANFLNILAIRNGQIPRPYIEPSTYWHLEGIGKAPADYTGKTIALIDLMRREELLEEELALVAQAKMHSDKLVEIETQAFLAVEGKLDDGSGQYTITGEPNLELARALLWGNEYIDAKATIMMPIKQFIKMVNQRTQAELVSQQTKLKEIISQELTILITLLLYLSGAILYIWWYILRPLRGLTQKTKAIAEGNLTARCDITNNTNELGALSNDFNQMASTVEKTIATARINEDRLLEAQQITQTGNWELDLIHNTLFWSHQIFCIFELDPHSFQPSYEAFLDTIHPDDRDAVDQAYRNAIIDRKSYTIAHRLLLPNGHVKWVNERCETFYDDQGNPTRSIGTVQDITTQKQLELKLDEQIIQLKNHISELNCLHQLADLKESNTLSLSESLERAVHLLPLAWSEPESVIIHIKFNGISYQNAPCENATHKLSAPLALHNTTDGQIEVFHSRKIIDFRLSLQEEKRLLNILTQQVMQIILHKEAEERIALYASVFKRSGEAMIIADTDKKIIASNQAFYHLMGYLEHEILGKNFELLLSAQITPEQKKDATWTLQEKNFWHGEVKIQHKNSNTCSVWLSISVIRNDKKQIINYIISIDDITDYKKAIDKIEYLAHHDSLTNLPNRLACSERLQQAINGARRNKEKVAVMFIDLDRFKLINDTLGHDTGDLLLIQVAQRLKSSVRRSDIVARIGGDEFIVVLPLQENIDPVYHIADKILRNLGQAYPLETQLIHSSPSIGIAFFPEDGDNPEAVMKSADTAMYYAKSKGRNNYQFFESSMNQTNLERLELDRDMRIALEQEQFVLYYQPKIDTDTSWVVGMEALIRWQHPSKGLIPPSIFIPLAEESGLMLPLGEWILHTACQQLHQWQHQENMSDLSLSVNLSQTQFRQPNLPETIESIIAQTNIDPRLLELEITESMAMENPKETIKSMQKLRAIGIRLALDDFGTGYSSLNYLKQLPINCVKLDRSFVKDIETDPNDAAICAATISLADSLGLDVVAEGVETLQQYEYLKRLKCGIIQGYYFSKPLPSTEIAAYIEHHKTKQLIDTHPTRQGNILIIDDDEWTCEFHKHLLENMRHKPVAISNPIEGLDLVRDKPEFFDLVMLDMLMPQMSGIDLIQEICQINPKIPIAVITSFKKDATRKVLRPVEKKYRLMHNINYFILEKPIIAEDIRALLSKLF